MSLRASPGEHEAKNRCKVAENYEQRFFGVRWSQHRAVAQQFP